MKSIVRYFYIVIVSITVLSLSACHNKNSNNIDISDNSHLQGDIQTTVPPQFHEQAKIIESFVNSAVAFANKSTLPTEELYKKLS